jgi:hypothetical protein
MDGVQIKAMVRARYGGIAASCCAPDLSTFGLCQNLKSRELIKTWASGREIENHIVRPSSTPQALRGDSRA